MKPLASDNSCLPDEALLCALQEEFARLNAIHFAGRLTCPEIELSRRKTYGGYYQPHRHRIVLSWQAYREHGWAETLNTFRHEVAHIVHPNHSQAFWAISFKLGATQRYAAAPLAAKPRPAPRYVYACPACGRLTPRYRRIRLASCAICDKRYNPQFVLKLVKD
jgi:predicted SprT family Zn-dependent metalloprotease